jgi:phenylacetate-CoA ligase
MALTRKLGYLSSAMAFQWLPLPAVRAYQLHRLRRMLTFCERQVPLYRERFAQAGVCARDLRSLDDLAHFPTLTREDVVAAFPDGILSRPPRADDVVFRTSGTSGLFMEIAYSARANDLLDAIYARALFSTGYRPWDRFAYFWDEDPKPLSIYERLGLMRKSYLRMDPDPRVQLHQLRELQPRYIYNFPSVMMIVARIVEQEGITDIRPRGIICHGEFMPKEIQQEIGRIFGCPVHNQYGAQEFNRVGWDCTARRGMHLDADSVVLEVLQGDERAEDGQEGELVITGLHNELMPLVRYRIGDMGRTLKRPCSCGRGLPLFVITEGRMDDLLTLPDGRRIGARLLAPRIERLKGFTQYRVVQTRSDHVQVLVVCEPDADGEVTQQVEQVVRSILGPSITVEMRSVDAIDLSRRGKLRKVISRIGDVDRTTC